jgi:hypothetical protein
MTAWDLNVLGGIDAPRFLLPVDTTGYTASLPASFTRVNTNPEAIGEYMGKIEYTTDYEYVEYSYDTGVSIEDKNFVAMVRIESDSDFELCFYGNSEFGNVDFDAIVNEPSNVLIYAKASGQAGTTIRFRIYGTQNATQSALLYFDDIFLSVVNDNMDMTQPTESKLMYEKITNGKNELWNGYVQEFSKRFRPNYVAFWEWLAPQYEAYRQRIANSQIVIVMPHLDVNWGMLGIWEKGYERRYFKKRFLAHEGTMVIKGINLVTKFPVLQSAGEVLYIAEDEFIIS